MKIFLKKLALVAFLNISVYAEKVLVCLFTLFMFFSAVFCNFTLVNHLFRLSILCLIVILLSNSALRCQIFSSQQFNAGLLIISCMLCYFCLSTLWSTQSKNLIHDLTHSVYLLLFIIIYKLVVIQGKRILVLWAVTIGMTTLAILTLCTVNIKTILYNRLTNGFVGAPTNVIDLAGYFVLGVLTSLIIIRDTNKNWFYLPIIFLLLTMLFTQSRGPLLSFLCTITILSILKSYKYKLCLIVTSLTGISTLVILFIIYFYGTFPPRIVNMYQESFIRFDIWRYTVELVFQKLFFGWGLHKQLSFTNLLGDKITTTHNLYLSALLKGGLIGTVLLISVIIYGCFMAKKQYDFHQEIEGAMFYFTIGFYFTQDTTLISSPNTAWYIFWFPLAVVLTTPISEY